MKMQEFGAPEGNYVGKFLGISPPRDEKPRMGRDGRAMPPAIAWEWQIVEDVENDGKYVGQNVGRMTSESPTNKNSCGTLLRGLLGRTPTPEEEIEPNDFRGRLYHITVGPSKEDPDKTYVIMVRPKTPASAGAGAAPARAPGVMTPPPSAGPPPRKPANGSTAPAAAPAKPARRFWVQLEGMAEPQLYDEVQLVRTVKDKKLDPQVTEICLEGDQEWKPYTSYGIPDVVPF